jgi:hypothetical protein
MANPFVQQGTLNRLLGNVVFAQWPQLTVTAPFLGKGAISFAFEGDASQLIGTMTGAVTSPEPYVFGTVTIHLVRSQTLANVFKNQLLLNTVLGSVTVYPDTTAMAPIDIESCVLQSIQEVTFDGTQAEFVVKIRGVYSINAYMFLTA